MSRLKTCVLLGALSAALCSPVFGQVASAELTGTVLDSTGAAVANAKVTATNVATNLTRDAASDSAGKYILTLLPPGDYTLSVEAAGFRKLVQSGITLQINQQAQVDLTLQLGQVSETVEVTGQAPLLESESSSLGTVVNQKLVNQLPLNGRNFIQLATLSPGVNGVGFSATGTIMSGTRPDDRRPATEIFSNGNREGSNNFLYDGIDDNERLTLSIVLRPAVEAVREFKIQTNLYSADIGRNSGAVVDVITKSGTNQLHGSLFEFLRNSAMDARNFFSPKGTAFPDVPAESIRRIVGRSCRAAEALPRQGSHVLLCRLRRLPARFAAVDLRQYSHGQDAHWRFQRDRDNLRSFDHQSQPERLWLCPHSILRKSDSIDPVGSHFRQDDQRLSGAHQLRAL